MDGRLIRSIAAVAAAFLGGALIAHGLDGGFAPGPASRAHRGGEAHGAGGVMSDLWSLFGRPRAADAPRQGGARPEGFAIWKTRLDTSGAAPIACVEMSRPLDPARAYGDFVLISPAPDHPPAVTVKDDELCLGGLGFEPRKITLLKGLPARTGETLAEDVDADFSFGDRPPYVGFAGAGVILPRDESDGVAIETVNVTRLRVKVWRIPDRNLPRISIDAPAPAGPGEWPEYDGEAPGDEGRVVWQGPVAVKGDGSGKAITVFPLGAVLRTMAPGGYVIEARDASAGGADDERDDGDHRPAEAQRTVIFTDMALTAYGGSRSLDVVARALKTARTLPGLKVVLMARDGETLASARTDANGHATFDRALLEGEGGMKARLVLAYGPKGDLASLDLDRAPTDLSKQGVGGRDPEAASALTDGRAVTAAIDGYVYADRGIYRPGERAHLVALVRNSRAEAVDDRSGYLAVKRPSGVEFRRYLFKRSDGGAVSAEVDLPAAAPHGRWTAELHIDGAAAPAGAASFAVEDFAPQRLAIAVEARKDSVVAAGETRPIDMTARFLYGAIGAGLKTQTEARLRADPTPFPRFADYRFGDASAPFAEHLLDLGASVTDGAGHARADFAPGDAADSPTPLSAQVVASVFEPGGRPVRESVQLKLRARPLYLGLKVVQGEASSERAPVVSLDLVAVNAAGNRVAAPRVAWTLVAERWDFDWFQQDGRWQWRRTARESVVDKGTLGIGADAPARLARRLDWGDYRLVLEGPDGARTVQRFASGWGAARGDADSPDLVRVAVAGDNHLPGQPVDIVIKAPFAGEAQVAVATDHLIDLRTLHVGPKGASLRLPTSAAWGGGAYVMVTVIQPRDPTSAPVPRRALGVAYVPLDPASRRLTVNLAAPERLNARDPVSVPVQVRGLRGGERAFVTVAAVDEGILALTKFESPDPVKWFFGKRALTIEYRDDYGRLLDANLGAPANVNFGGDQIGGEGLTKTPIKTVALWSGVVRTDASGRALVKLPAGAFNGELRLMAVAWTHAAVGGASRPMTVREPVVADLDLPRFLAPGDHVLAVLELQNLEGRPGAYRTTATGSGGPGVAFAETQTLAAGQRLARAVPVAGADHSGVGQVSFTVAGPDFSTTKSYDIETRIGWGPITRVTTALQAPGETFTPGVDLLTGLAAGDVTLQVSYSPFHGFDPATVALSLSRYPYGCTEQLVSAAYPRIYAGEAGGGARGGQGVTEALGRLLDRQGLDGAFGLWRVGDSEADPWLGAYVTDFLLEAKAAGAAVPDTALDKALAAMRQVSLPEGFSEVSYRMTYPEWWGVDKDHSEAATKRMRSRASAYALYVLAKAGHGDLPRLRWWHDVQMDNEGSPLARAQIGAGLAFMGDQARARSSLTKAVAALGYRDRDDPYQSPLRDLAGVIALAYEAGAPDIARPLQVKLEESIRDPDRLNTQEQARLLQAAHFMLRAAGAIRIDAAGAQAQPTAAGAPRWTVGRLADARFVNRGAGSIWRTVTVRGTTLRAPDPASAGLTLAKAWFTRAGQTADPEHVRQGDRIIVRLSGHSAGARTIALAVNDALPAGFEVEAVLGPADSTDGAYKFLGELTPAGAQEARDDRYVASMTLGGGKDFAVAYVARAVTPGDYFRPGAEAFDMYHAGVQARTAAGRLTVSAAP